MHYDKVQDALASDFAEDLEIEQGLSPLQGQGRSLGRRAAPRGRGTPAGTLGCTASTLGFLVAACALAFLAALTSTHITSGGSTMARKQAGVSHVVVQEEAGDKGEAEPCSEETMPGPCEADEELSGSLCYKKCALLTGGNYSVRTSGWSCCREEPCSLSNTQVDVGVCSGFSVAGGHVASCPRQPGQCQPGEELFNSLCYRTCSNSTGGNFSLRVAGSTCCKRDHARDDEHDCSGEGMSHSSPKYNVGIGPDGKDSEPHAPGSWAGGDMSAMKCNPTGKPNPDRHRDPHAPDHGQKGNCSDAEELFEGLCYTRCRILTNGTHPQRTSGWSCCKGGGSCSMNDTKIHFGVCSGFAVRGGLDHKRCPEAPMACREDEEPFGNLCYKKCRLLTADRYAYRAAATSCCKVDEFPRVIKCLAPGLSVTDHAFDVGGDGPTSQPTTLPELELKPKVIDDADPVAGIGSVDESVPAVIEKQSTELLVEMGGFFYLQNVESELCARAEYGELLNGAHLVYAKECTGTDTLLEKVYGSQDDVEKGHFHLKLVESSYCVNVDAGEVGDDAKLIFRRTCGGEKNKFRESGKDSSGHFFLQSVAGNFCVHVDDMSPVPGAQLMMYEGCRGANNRFVTVPVEESVIAEQCGVYVSRHGCAWTSQWGCPGVVGAKGTAQNDGSFGYECCCNFGLWKQQGVFFAMEFQECTSAVMEDPALLSQFSEALRSAIATVAHVKINRVQLQLSEGRGVVVEALVLADEYMEKERVTRNLNNETRVAIREEAGLKSIKGISAVCSGTGHPERSEALTRAELPAESAECEVLLEAFVKSSHSSECLTRCHESRNSSVHLTIPGRTAAMQALNASHFAQPANQKVLEQLKNRSCDFNTCRWECMRERLRETQDAHLQACTEEKGIQGFCEATLAPHADSAAFEDAGLMDLKLPGDPHPHSLSRAQRDYNLEMIGILERIPACSLPCAPSKSMAKCSALPLTGSIFVLAMALAWHSGDAGLV